MRGHWLQMASHRRYSLIFWYPEIISLNYHFIAFERDHFNSFQPLHDEIFSCSTWCLHIGESSRKEKLAFKCPYYRSQPALLFRRHVGSDNIVNEYSPEFFHAVSDQLEAFFIEANRNPNDESTASSISFRREIKIANLYRKIMAVYRRLRLPISRQLYRHYHRWVTTVNAQRFNLNIGITLAAASILCFDDVYAPDFINHDTDDTGWRLLFDINDNVHSISRLSH